MTDMNRNKNQKKKSEKKNKLGMIKGHNSWY